MQVSRPTRRVFPAPDRVVGADEALLCEGEGARDAQKDQMRSTTVPVPSPPPQHIETSP
jgi:hypothetical protein